MPGSFPAAPVCKVRRLNRTKMFHVKHFGKVRSQNLTRPKTAASPSSCKIDQFFGAIGIG
jgi:hypothetical protein